MEEIKQIDLSNKVYQLVIAIIVLVALFCAVHLYYIFQTLPQNYPQEISVSGSGKIYAKPDVAVVVLGVEDRNVKISNIVQGSTDKMNKIITDVKELGVEEKDIQTTQYSITPEYNWTERGGRIFVGYVITQQITVKIRDFDKIGSILDKATADGANSIGDLQFTIDDMEVVRAEAREKAIAEAKTKASTLAKQVGIKLVKITNIFEGYASYPQPMYDKGAGVMMESASVAPEIQPGQMEINSTVTLTYRVR